MKKVEKANNVTICAEYLVSSRREVILPEGYSVEDIETVYARYDSYTITMEDGTEFSEDDLCIVQGYYTGDDHEAFKHPLRVTAYHTTDEEMFGEEMAKYRDEAVINWVAST